MTEELSVGRVTGAIYLSPHPTPDLDPKPALLALITKATHTLTFAIYSLTDDDIAQAIIDAHKRGVVVRGVADAGEVKGVTNDVGKLIAAGVDVRVWGSTWRLLHDKVLVVDNHAVALGSYNWTTQAERSNVECLFVATGVAVTRTLGPTLTAQIENAYAQGVAPS